ncbi:MAG: hypothetical protein JRD05_08075 [Deltaproteobacteria bacterium]|nr:hypothetical protein [Deltaproteobacteria bacterium]
MIQKDEQTSLPGYFIRSSHENTGEKMHIYSKIYKFAASAGAFEGYVYKKKDAEELDMDALSVWIDNIVAAYDHLPDEAINFFQDSCDRTLGRAISSLTPVLGEDHDFINKLKSMVKGSMPESADDFNKKKWFQE